MVLEKFVFIPNPESKARNRSILPDLNLKKVDLIFTGQVQVLLKVTWNLTWKKSGQPEFTWLTWIDLNENWTKINQKFGVKIIY